MFFSTHGPSSSSKPPVVRVAFPWQPRTGLREVTETQVANEQGGDALPHLSRIKPGLEADPAASRRCRSPDLVPGEPMSLKPEWSIQIPLTPCSLACVLSSSGLRLQKVQLVIQGDRKVQEL